MAHDHSHHHHHGHDHSHGPTTEGFNKAFAIATFINLGFTIVETIYAFSAHSMGLLADAGHNLGDVFGLMMAWGASILLTRSATEKYSYGYKKMTFLSALANALLLVFAAAIIIYESIHKLFYPVAINEVVVMIVAMIGVLINGGTALLFLRHKETDFNVKAAYMHLAYDALISISVAVAAAIIYFTGWTRLDPLIGIGIVIVILSGTWNLLRHSIDLILGAVPHGVDQHAIRNYLSGLTGVKAVHDLHIWALSTQENALTAHLVMPTLVLSDADYECINHTLMHEYKINHVTIQVEKGDTDNPCGQALKC